MSPTQLVCCVKQFDKVVHVAIDGVDDGMVCDLIAVVRFRIGPWFRCGFVEGTEDDRLHSDVTQIPQFLCDTCKF